MNRRDTIVALLAPGAIPLGAFAQQPGKVWRIGMLETTSMSLNPANLDAFLKGMQDLGSRGETSSSTIARLTVATSVFRTLRPSCCAGKST